MTKLQFMSSLYNIAIIGAKANAFSSVWKPFEKMATDVLSILQGGAIIIFTCLIVIAKFREATADGNNDQQYSHKAKKLVVILVTIFVIKPLVSAIVGYF